MLALNHVAFSALYLTFKLCNALGVFLPPSPFVTPGTVSSTGKWTQRALLLLQACTLPMSGDLSAARVSHKQGWAPIKVEGQILFF